MLARLPPFYPRSHDPCGRFDLIDQLAYHWVDGVRLCAFRAGGGGELLKLSTRSRYACRALVSISRAHLSGRQVQLKEVATQQDISPDYLAQLVGVLKSAGLVATHRGTGGGIQMSRCPSEVTVADVVRITEGSLAPVECVDRPEGCPRASRCAMREVWIQLTKALENTLRRYTLADLARREEELSSGALMYYI